jgi:predicted nucleotide-binding protein
MIERAGLNAVILHEQPNAGRTIIEKFEAHGGSAGFAVVVLTPDDLGRPIFDLEHGKTSSAKCSGSQAGLDATVSAP